MKQPENEEGRHPSQVSGLPDAQGATITTLSLTGRADISGYKLADLPDPIRIRTTVDPQTGCWRCSASHDKDGYARHRGEGVHRIVYRQLVGPIPDGLQIDHVRDRGCAYTDCCNPEHLEPVRQFINWLRGNSPARINADKECCDHGHPFSLANTYWKPGGGRDCRACIRRRVREYRKRRQAAQRAPAHANFRQAAW